MGAVLGYAGHLVAVAVVVLVLAKWGGTLARRLRYDEVIGEIVAGITVALLIIWLAGPAVLRVVAPENVLAGLKLVAEIGLILFLVGITHELRLRLGGGDRRAVGGVAVGGFVPALLLGLGLAAWVVRRDDPALRGQAPTGAFVLFLAVAMAITAVPVLARIINDRGIGDTPVARIALAAAIVEDSAGWLVLSLAVSLNADRPAALARSLLVLLGGALVALLLRRVLRTPTAARLATRWRPVNLVGISVVAVAVALGTERLGLTVIFGAVLVGLAIPADAPRPWGNAVSAISRFGRRLVPLYFAVTGFAVFSTLPGSVPWVLVAVVVALGFLGKVGGGYLGARLGGRPHGDALRIGMLMNTRGLTELVVLQVGFAAGILSGTLFLAFLIMALVTTACTGPALALLDARDRRRRPVPEADRSGG